MITATAPWALAAEPKPVDTETATPEAQGQAPTEEELATARMHFANGVELVQSNPPNYQDAFRQFQLAYEKTHGSWKVMGNLGLCALKLERDGEALAYYQGYLQQGGDEINPDERAHIEREMLLIQGNMATIEITTSEPDVRLAVSRQGSSVPVQIYEQEDSFSELGLRAGTLKITATNAAGKTLEWQKTVAAGETVAHEFDFAAKEPVPPAEAAGPTVPARDSSAASSKMSGLRISGIVSAGVGVAALGGGAVLGALSQSKETKARDECINDICRQATKDDFDSAKTMATVANVLFISGGVLAAAGITLIIVGKNEPESAETAALVLPKSTFRMELSPVAQAGGGGLFARGTF